MTKDILSRSSWLKHLPSCFGVKEDEYALHAGPFRQQVTVTGPGRSEVGAVLSLLMSR